jgi:NAD(P)-dependent dehydrogenase (short-subunit alcohol dehydrogenase family)
LKAALNRLVQSLALELAEDKVTVNAIASGATAKRNDYFDEELKHGYISFLVPP